MLYSHFWGLNCYGLIGKVGLISSIWHWSQIQRACFRWDWICRSRWVLLQRWSFRGRGRSLGYLRRIWNFIGWFYRWWVWVWFICELLYVWWLDFCVRFLVLFGNCWRRGWFFIDYCFPACFCLLKGRALGCSNLLVGNLKNCCFFSHLIMIGSWLYFEWDLVWLSKASWIWFKK